MTSSKFRLFHAIKFHRQSQPQQSSSSDSSSSSTSQPQSKTQSQSQIQSPCNSSNSNSNNDITGSPDTVTNTSINITSFSPDSNSNSVSTSISTANRRRSSTCPSSLDRPRPSLSYTSSKSSSSITHRNTNTNTNTNTNSSHGHRSRNRSPSPPPQNRSRLNSREIPRTYSGLYGIGGGMELSHQTQTPSSDLLPFELSRNYNTNWLYSYPDKDFHKNNTSHLRNNIMSSSLLWIYIFFILFVEFTLVVLPLPIVQSHVEYSFTITNILHGIITLIFLHWLKGSPNFYDYGELNALTTWEQLSCSPESNIVANQTKKVLYIIPTVLCYVSCKSVNFEPWISCLNLGVWLICIVAKWEGMHGVRLFGLNRTIGIDDDVRKIR